MNTDEASAATYASLLSTDQDMIAERSAIDAQAQDFVVYDELLLPILKTFVQ
jgi:hypothetical protein